MDYFRDYDDDGPTYGVEDPTDRLTHLVFVGGQLLDAWTEPAQGTRWAYAARRLRPPPVPVRELPSPVPLHVSGLAWLSDVCGGRDALDNLDAAPLADTQVKLPVDDLDLRSRHRLESAAGLIDSTVAGLFDDEATVACHTALVALWQDSPEVVRTAASAAHLVGGIAWAVGKANGYYGQRGTMTQTEVQKALSLPSALSSPGQKVAAALRGLKPARERPHEWRTIPDIEPLGRTDLLVSRIRRQLIELRDQVRAEAPESTS